MVDRLLNIGPLDAGKTKGAGTLEQSNCDGKEASAEWMRPVKGLMKFKLQACSKFELEFHIRLAEVPPPGGSVIHICFDGDPKTCLPHIYFGRSRLQLCVKVWNMGSGGTADSPPLAIGKDHHVRFEMRGKECTFSLDGFSTSIDLQDVSIPLLKHFWVYTSSPKMRAAECTISGVTCCELWSAHDLSEDMFFELPPSEKKLQAELREELARTKHWVHFDCFFGPIMVLNILVFGLTMEYDVWTNTDVMQKMGRELRYIDFGFDFVFFIELLLRLRKQTELSRNGSDDESVLWGILTNYQMMFDVVVFVATLISYGVDQTKTSSVRAFRALRLVKMARLLSFVRVLGILVNALLVSCRTLLWAFLLLCTSIFTGAIVCICLCESLSQQIERLPQDEQVSMKKSFAPFIVRSGEGNLFWAMVRLLSMATFDMWTPPIQSAWRVGTIHGFLLTFAFVLVIVVVGFVILNVVPGIMAFYTFGIDARLRRLRTADGLETKCAVMKQLRHKLKSYGERPLFKNQQFISVVELLEAATSDGPIASDLSKLKISFQELTSLAKHFSDVEHLAIDGVVEAIGSIVLQRHFDKVSTDFDNRSSKGSLRPSDMLFIRSGLTQMRMFLDETANHANVVCSLAYDIMSALHSRSYQAYTVFKPKKSLAVSQHPKRKEPTALGVIDLANLCMGRNEVVAEITLNASLDAVYSVVMFLNAIYLGIIAQNPSSIAQYWEMVADLAFALAFTIEFALRLVLFGNIQIVLQKIPHYPGQADLDEDDESTDVNAVTVSTKQGLCRLRERMRCKGLIPPVPPGGLCSVILWLPKYLKADKAHLLDFVVVIISISDCVVLHWLSHVSLNIVSLVRAFRFLRIVRLLRTFRVLPKLNMLILALGQLRRSFVTILTLLVLLLYVYGMFVTILFDQRSEKSSTLPDMFGDIFNSMFTGWQLMTWDGWDRIIKNINKADWSLLGLSIFMFLVGGGLIKMVIGILWGAAVLLGRTRKIDARREETHAFLVSMGNFQELSDGLLGTRVIAQEIFEAAFGIKMRPRLVPMSSSRIISAEAISYSLEAGRSSYFRAAMCEIFERAKVTPSEVKQVFEKADFGRTGFLTIDNFAKSALVLKEDFGKVDVYANSIALENIKRGLSQTNELIHECFMAAQDVIEDVNALVQRKSGETRESKSDTDFRTVRESTQDALSKLGMISVQHRLRGAWRYHTSIGEGKIYFIGHTCHGVQTNFRTSVTVGDVLVWGRLGHAVDGTTSAVVSVVVADNRLIVRRGSAKMTRAMAFTIVRHKQKNDLLSDRHPKAASSELTLMSGMSPRVAQQFLEWDVHTRDVEIESLGKLEQERDALKTQVTRLEEELGELSSRRIVFIAWHCLKKNRQASKMGGRHRRSPIRAGHAAGSALEDDEESTASTAPN
eukprot:TRINITY_DN5169_c0_g1_i1.p1 TRINITY_DN5169_c0_g1~~TRINITY_DN5169_c0_g1_i1.p1  ORF type:complete len:1409 (+),score=163.34 TRINITY_DN5169_c0_g1_i1:134-4360(+)